MRPLESQDRSRDLNIGIYYIVRYQCGVLVVVIDVAVICSRSGSLYLIDLLSGKSSLLSSLSGEVFSSPVVCGGRHVVVGCRDNNVYCFKINASQSLAKPDVQAVT